MALTKYLRHLLDRFAAEITALKTADPKAAFVITSRQAFHAKHPSALPIECDVFHILDFGDSDVKGFVEAHGVRSEEFAKAISEAQCEEEITNPFILSVMVERYKEIGQFSALRSENVAYMIDRLIATRPNVNPKRQRRALRMLGMACETYCRNELTEAEALQVLLEAIEISESQAREILDELSHSILIRDAEGWGCPSARASRTVLDGRGRHAPDLLLREGSLPDVRDYMLGDPVFFRGSRAHRRNAEARP
jgi:hypothetical protein